jgi:hypothetical protein
VGDEASSFTLRDHFDLTLEGGRPKLHTLFAPSCPRERARAATVHSPHASSMACRRPARAGTALSLASFALALTSDDPPPLLVSVDLDAPPTNPSVNRRFMGCHHDYGYCFQNRFVDANLLYGSSFEPRPLIGNLSSSWVVPQVLPSWVASSLPANATGEANTLAFYTTGITFMAHGSMSLTVSAGSPNGTASLVSTRGLGNAGFSLLANQPYEVSLWARSITDQPNAAYVELRDYTTGASLARADLTVSGNYSVDQDWLLYTVTLTPSQSTSCVDAGYDDPEVDCGLPQSPGYVCVKCGGEFVIGAVGGGAWVALGHVSLSPGPWGRVPSPYPGQAPLPLLKSGADVLAEMGITLIRAGGTVGRLFRWKDWRGPPWKRASLGSQWGFTLLGDVGPFDMVDLGAALGIEVVLTLSCDANDDLDWADLVEYCWGDPVTTTWGRRRARDGHPQTYNVSVFELGNECVRIK